MRLVSVMLVAVMLVGFVSCGGGGPPSHADFVHDSGRVCRMANDRFAKVDLVEASGPGAGVGAALADIVEIGSVALDDLRRLKPPKVDAADVSAWLGALEQALDEITYARSLLHDDEVVRAVAALARADVLTGRARELGRVVGVDRVCAVPHLLSDDPSS